MRMQKFLPAIAIGALLAAGDAQAAAHQAAQRFL